MATDESGLHRLVEQARKGDESALSDLWSRYEDRLRRMAKLRLDRRLAGRVGVSQILRNAHADAMSRLEEFTSEPCTCPYIWFRRVVGQRLEVIHRQELGATSTTAGRELSLFRDPLPTTSSAELAAQLLGQRVPPAQAAARAGRILRIQEALNALEPLDREVLTLRHFEQLSGSEAAQELGVEEAVAARRYVVALRRLKEILASS
jgi:RNA polymerase sigma-70 factor (ECF subfamily)